MDEIDELLGRVNSGSDLEQLRDAIALLIGRTLEARRAGLSYWEKVHYEMAIALLPTVWLRLCLTHLKMAQEPPDDKPRFFDDSERRAHFERLNAADLLVRLKRTWPVR